MSEIINDKILQTPERLAISKKLFDVFCKENPKISKLIDGYSPQFKEGSTIIDPIKMGNPDTNYE